MKYCFITTNNININLFCLMTNVSLYVSLTLYIICKGRMGTMLTPELAAIILLAVCVLLLIVIPILDGSKRLSKYISLRYTMVAIALIMALGCVLDFSHLAESSRNIVLTGGLILVGVFVAVRTIEKMKLGGKTIEISIEKDGTKMSTTLHGEYSPTDKKQKTDDKTSESKKKDKESTDDEHVDSDLTSCDE